MATKPSLLQSDRGEQRRARHHRPLREYGLRCSTSPTHSPATSATGAPSAASPRASPPRRAQRPVTSG